jgi:acetyl-CoA acetyltransferase family protein
MPVVVLDAVRTPLGAVHGALAAVHPVDLLAATLRALGARCPVVLDPDAADRGLDVIVGCVEQVGGQGGNVARAAVLVAGWPHHASGATVDRGTVSGPAALAHAVALVASGAVPLAVAAAVDVPSLVPPGAAAMGRYPYGRPWDGVFDRHALAPPGRAAEHLGIPRDRQDAWAQRSAANALAAASAGAFGDELVALDELDADELPPARVATAEELAALPPMFDEGGTLTAGNAAPGADGAVAVVVADAGFAADRGLGARAEVAAVTLRTGAPDDPLRGALLAVDGASRRGVTPSGAGSVELAEPSGAVAVALADALGLGSRHPAVNPAGGALGLGDPTAGSGLRALVTLVHRLGRDGLDSGLVVSAGVGDGAAIALRRPR